MAVFVSCLPSTVKCWESSHLARTVSFSCSVCTAFVRTDVTCVHTDALRDVVPINRLRVGHTRLTHSYLLSRDDQPVCSACQSSPHSLLSTFSLNVLILLLSVAGIPYFSASSMKDVFKNVNAQSVIEFIKEIYFYYEL